MRSKKFVVAAGAAVVAVLATVLVALAVSGGGGSTPAVERVQAPTAAPTDTVAPAATETPAPEPTAAPVSATAVVSSSPVLATAVAATAEPESTSSTTVPPSPPTVQPGGPGGIPPSGLDITRSYNNMTIHMHVGETFLLHLGSDNDLIWTAQVADQSVVARVPNVLVIRGAQGIYRAAAPGTTDVTAVGDAACRQSTPPCMVPSFLFRMTVVVDP